ncbi:MAG: AAA family ATPase [Candidatus Coatesbacteria bacterium]|nr:AAA family ATPase [Candidatus Coatesbacteria bacterium]
METISFYSYKGGTGRTLLLANIAHYLARFGQKVVVLDFDLEAPGLHHKFKVGGCGDPVRIERGLVDYIYEFSDKDKIAKDLAPYLISVPVARAAKGTIQLFPAGDSPSRDYWKKLLGINWQQMLYGPGAPGVLFFRELKERIREEIRADFLLIDSRTGVTEMGGVAAAILPEKLVCLLLHNQENIEGARAVLQSIRSVPRLPPDAKPPELTVVLSRIPARLDSKQEQDLIEDVKKCFNKEAENLEDTLQVSDVFVVHSEPDLQVAERLLIGAERIGGPSLLLDDYIRLAAAIIPMEVLRSARELLREGVMTLLDDPEEVQKNLEMRAERGDQDAKRELVRFHRLRNSPMWAQLARWMMLWELLYGDE